METLPTEIQCRILALAPEARWCSRTLYRTHNQILRTRFLQLVALDKFELWRPFLQDYTDGVRFLNGALQELVSPEPLWSIVWGFLNNRKFFLHGDELAIQGDQEIHFEPYTTLRIDHIRSFYYTRTISLPFGHYNYQLALTPHVRTTGLGTMRFALDGGLINYPPVNITEMMEPGKLSVFNAGKFSLIGGRHKLHKFKVTIDESGMALKRHLEFHHLDFGQCSIDSLEPLFYTLDDNEGCHILEKRVHIALDLLIDGDGDLSVVPEAVYSESLQDFSQRGQRRVKMLNASEQKLLKDQHTTGLRHWKLAPLAPLAR